MVDEIRKKQQPDHKKWQDSLTPEQYHITREGGTEAPFSGQYHDHHGHGIYCCTCCRAELFNSGSKFDSGSGWPSFRQAIDNRAIRTLTDQSHSMNRTEARCLRCDAHLGHVFNDGPPPEHTRYCINSAALDFKAKLVSGKQTGA